MKEIIKTICRRITSLFFAELIKSYRRKETHRNDRDLVIAKRFSDPLFLEKYGYKVYSQNDEDGIIEEIFCRIGTTDKYFIEFGVQDGLESNSHFLLHKGWKGLWIEGNNKDYKKIIKIFSAPISDKRLTVLNAFVTADNINSLIEAYGGGVQIDLLSIDIDGNDYWVWKAIDCINPRVVAIEYNVKFPPNHEWVMKYDEFHVWQSDDAHSASLKSLELLGREKGYQLVGTNMTGTNAFFVKKELCSDLFPAPATAENLYNGCGFIETAYISGQPAKKYIGN